MIKRKMLILATVGVLAVLSSPAQATNVATDCKYKPMAERLAVGKDVWICRTHRGGEPAGRGDRGRNRGEGQSDSSQDG